MNLLFLDQFSDPGGAQMNLLDLLPALRDAGWKATIAMPGDGRLFARVQALGFETARIRCGPYGSGEKSWGDFARFLADTPPLARSISRMAERADVVYVNGPRLLPSAALAGIQAPVLFHAHSFLGQGAARRLAGYALRRLNARVVGQCEFAAAPWRNFVGGERVSVIYNGVAGPARVTPRGEGPPRVGCIGRIAPEKGQREFVASAARIHRALPECRFVVYGAPLFGDAGERYAKQVRAEAAGLPVEFAGWVEDVGGGLRELDLLLVPSTAQEATTRVILEAFAYGVPVVAFASGGIPEVVQDGITGALVKNVAELAERAIELLRGDDRHAMAVAARRNWEQRFTLERYRREVMAAISACPEPPAQAACQRGP